MKNVRSRVLFIREFFCYILCAFKLYWVDHFIKHISARCSLLGKPFDMGIYPNHLTPLIN